MNVPISYMANRYNNRYNKIMVAFCNHFPVSSNAQLMTELKTATEARRSAVLCIFIHVFL